MHFLKLFAAIGWLLVSSVAAAQAAEERAQLDWVQARGWLIYVLDRAAWVASDDMLAHLPETYRPGVRGWIVERDGRGQIVTFFGGATQALAAYYRARIEDGRVVSSDNFTEGSRPLLTPIQRRLASVVEIARGLDRRPCASAPSNTVVIPPADIDDPVDVYLLTPQTRTGEWPIGGHFRATIAANGTVVSSRAFTNSCISIGGAARPNEASVALFVTHLLDPLPTEIHVFTMWTSRMPIGVGTTNPVPRVWWLSSDGITLETPNPAPRTH